jgi:adenosylmethionine-8-amino-7-oxononanoate aminotransferase
MSGIPMLDELDLPDAAALRARDRSHVWHTWSPTGADLSKLALWRGAGHHVWDINGRRYIDASALNSTCGYAHPEVVAAVSAQLGRLHHVDVSLGTHEPIGLLAERLSSYLPAPLSRTLFVNSGSEGFEAAMLIAASYWAYTGEPRHRVVTFADGYQGSTLVSRDLSALPRVGHPFTSPLPSTRIALPAPACEIRKPRWTRPLLDRFARALEGEDGQPAMAVVVEPFLNVGGGVVLPPGFLTGLRELCDRYGTLLILDEVFTGFGRIGKMFGFEWENADPDILVTSKGLSGGYMPIAAVTVRDWISESLAQDPVIGGLRYGHTTSGHPVACMAALATLDVVEREGLVKRSAVAGARLLGELEPLAGSSGVMDVRGRGLTVVLEADSAQTASAIIDRARANGLLLRRQGAAGQAVLIVPPLIIDDAGLAELAQIVRSSVTDS